MQHNRRNEANVLWFAICTCLGWMVTASSYPSCNDVDPLSLGSCTRYVTHSGNNSNDCKTIETACASIDAALEKTNTTGEIICVDSTGGKAYAMASNTSKSIVLRSINGRATIQCSSPLFRAIEAKGGPSSYCA
jgi:hypothetical protein